MLRALAECRIYYRYISLIKHIYDNATSCVRLHQDTDAFPVERGVRQGDNISPKLFTALLEFAFKQHNWDNLGINIDGEYLNHLRFTDDIMLIADRLDDAQKMLDDLNNSTRQVGLNINFSKTQFMTNLVPSTGTWKVF